MLTYNEWKLERIHYDPFSIRDLEGVAYLQRKFNLEYFMPSAIKIFNGATFEARTIKFYEFQDILNFFESNTGNPLYIYEIYYLPVKKPIYAKEGFDPPEVVNKNMWVLRVGMSKVISKRGE